MKVWFETPPHVRPTTSRLREVLFDVLRSRWDLALLPQLSMLDLYAGSGAVGITFLLQGGGHARLVDSSRDCCRVIRDNARRLAVSKRSQVLCEDAGKLQLAPTTHDLIFADPPYDMPGTHLGPALRKATVSLRPRGLMVLELSSRGEIPELPELSLVRDRNYGKSRLVMWQRS